MLSSVIEKIIPGSFNSLDHDTVHETEKVITTMNSIQKNNDG